MNCSIHPEAEQDIASALDFYQSQAGPSTALRFLDEFERVVQLLLEYPGFGTPTTKNRRVFPLKLFPYSVVYRQEQDNIRVLIVRHQHRKANFAVTRQ